MVTTHDIEGTIVILKEKIKGTKLFFVPASTENKLAKEKFFIPDSQKIESLALPNKDAAFYFSYFGFSLNSKSATDIGGLWKNMLDSFVPFEKSKVVRMSEATKELIKQKAVEGIIETFRTYKTDFFLESEVVKSDYEEIRLEYLLKYLEEPKKVYSNDDFEYIVTHMKVMFELALELYFSKDSTKDSTKIFLGMHGKPLIHRFHLKMLERFDTHSLGVLLSLENYIQQKIEKNKMTEEEIKDFHKHKISLLTINLNRFKPDKEQVAYLFHGMILIELCINHPETVSRMLTKETANEICSYMIEFVSMRESEFEKITGITSIASVNTTKTRRNNCITKIPAFLELVEQQFS